MPLPIAEQTTYREIASDGTTTLKTGAGFLRSVAVNAPGGGTIQIFDNTSAEAPAIAGATAFSLPAAGTVLEYEVFFYKGLTIVIAGMTAGSITASFA
jgi:hypothetical protein